MKRILAMMTAALIVASMMAVTAFAADDEGTVCDPSEVHGGEKIPITLFIPIRTAPSTGWTTAWMWIITAK